MFCLLKCVKCTVLLNKTAFFNKAGHWSIRPLQKLAVCCQLSIETTTVSTSTSLATNLRTVTRIG